MENFKTYFHYGVLVSTAWIAWMLVAVNFVFMMVPVLIILNFTFGVGWAIGGTRSPFYGMTMFLFVLRRFLAYCPAHPEIADFMRAQCGIRSPKGF